jgi:hypothetical protein
MHVIMGSMSACAVNSYGELSVSGLFTLRLVPLLRDTEAILQTRFLLARR